MNIRPIGVLDSGVGGLTVLKEILKELPEESTIYIGDSKNAPYGKRTPEDIRSLTTKLIQFLLAHDSKLIVVACNTITVNGIEKLRELFPQIPLIGTVPVIKTASALTKKKKIGLLVTEATAKSSYNQQLISQFASDCEVVTIGTNKLVPLIESQEHNLLMDVVATELAPFKKAGVDVVVLGSTHFPILRTIIAGVMGEGVEIIDSGGAVARQVRRILTNNNALRNGVTATTHSIYTTGAVAPFTTVAKKVLGKDVLIRHVKLSLVGGSASKI